MNPLCAKEFTGFCFQWVSFYFCHRVLWKPLGISSFLLWLQGGKLLQNHLICRAELVQRNFLRGNPWISLCSNIWGMPWAMVALNRVRWTVRSGYAWVTSMNISPTERVITSSSKHSRMSACFLPRRTHLSALELPQWPSRLMGWALADHKCIGLPEKPI